MFDEPLAIQFGRLPHPSLLQVPECNHLGLFRGVPDRLSQHFLHCAPLQPPSFLGNKQRVSPINWGDALLNILVEHRLSHIIQRDFSQAARKALYADGIELHILQVQIDNLIQSDSTPGSQEDNADVSGPELSLQA